jgi:hypothetical protein
MSALLSSASLTVGTIDFYYLDPFIVKEPGQLDTPRPGALHTDQGDRTEADQPAEQIFEAGFVGGKRLDTKQPTVGIDHRCHMGISVGIHTTNNVPYHQHDRPFLSLRAKGWHALAGTADHDPTELDYQLNR